MSDEVRTYRLRPWWVIVLALLLAVAGAGRPPTVVVGPVTDPIIQVGPDDPGGPADPMVGGPGRPGPAAYPATGSGRWYAVGGVGPVVGENGPLLRYRVTVETDISGVDPDDFAAEVETTLGDPRGWTAGGGWRLQRVDRATRAEFTVDLATPGTADRLCGGRGAAVGSCRAGDRVVLDVARWLRGLASHRAPLTEYHQYLVNHGVGFRLGRVLQRCPGAGLPAPVMQRQADGLDGCRPNPWPYPVGEDDLGEQVGVTTS